VREPWWKSAVIYQVYPRSFQDGNGDGVGDLGGLIARLDYLSWLGVDAIWLSPIFPSPMVDFGYDVSDYCAVDPVFGSLDDLRRLLDEAHRRGLRVILDQVLNHTSDQHPWFRESASSRDNPKANWYLWVDGPPDTPPNNWRSFFGGGAWKYEPRRGQHYLHLFAPEQPDLNWRNPEVKRALFDVLRFWLDLGVDGFRLDVVNLFFKDEKLRDNPPRRGPASPVEFWNFHHVFVRDRPETLLAVEELQALCESYGDRVTIGEVATDLGLGQYVEYTKPARLNLAFNFDFKHTSIFQARAFEEQVRLCEAAFRDVAWPSYVLGNHDTRRVLSRLCAGPSPLGRARVLAALLLTVRGTPFIYYGEELGMEEADIPFERIVDPQGKNLWPHHAGRDGCRTPMQWDGSPRAGFSTVEPWLPVPESARQVNVAAQRDQTGSLLSYYRELLALRRRSPALLLGELRLLEAPARDLLVYLRQHEQEQKLVVLSFSDHPQRVDLPALIPGQRCRLAFSSAQRPADELLPPGLNLAPLEVLIAEVLP
jgi:alpha-glucosidase